MKRCSRCLYDESVSSISFDEKGVCNYCYMHDDLEKEYPVGEEGRKRLETIADRIRQDGRKKKYDVIVGVSGGCDSTYMLHLAKKVLGLRPLAVHYDNTWNSKIAVENIHNALKTLDIDLFTYVVDNKEYDDIYRSFFKAGVVEVDMPTDIALAATLNQAAAKYGIKYIFEGHSFRTEGISPLGWVYMDGKFIESVQKQYGTCRLKTFPNLWFHSFMRATIFQGLKKIRPLYFSDYRKKEAMDLITREMGWQWYGGHHLENRFTAFQHTYLYPRRTGIDTRLLGHAALVRSGQMPREEGLERLSQPQICDPEIVELVKKRLGFSEDEFERLMKLPIKTYRDFKTYKKLFERLRPLFWVLYKVDRVPKSFYMKYTAPDLGSVLSAQPVGQTSPLLQMKERNP